MCAIWSYSLPSLVPFIVGVLFLFLVTWLFHPCVEVTSWMLLEFLDNRDHVTWTFTVSFTDNSCQTMWYPFMYLKFMSNFSQFGLWIVLEIPCALFYLALRNHAFGTMCFNPQRVKGVWDTSVSFDQSISEVSISTGCWPSTRLSCQWVMWWAAMPSVAATIWVPQTPQVPVGDLGHWAWQWVAIRLVLVVFECIN